LVWNEFYHCISSNRIFHQVFESIEAEERIEYEAQTSSSKEFNPRNHQRKIEINKNGNVIFVFFAKPLNLAPYSKTRVEPVLEHTVKTNKITNKLSYLKGHITHKWDIAMLSAN
jgi:hypothetical protein